jgi:hypothetical protein
VKNLFGLGKVFSDFMQKKYFLTPVGMLMKSAEGLGLLGQAHGAEIFLGRSGA